MFLFFIFYETYASKKICNIQNTSSYIRYKNFVNTLYQKNTYIGNDVNKCMKFSRNNYIKKLCSAGIVCNGVQCKSQNYNCESSYSCKYTNYCYEVEHIVEKQNTPYDNCNIDILGNIIMADKTWNREVGNLCWKYTEEEKKNVYGTEILCNAIMNVIECSKINQQYRNCNYDMPKYCKYNKIESNNHITNNEHNTNDHYFIFFVLSILGCTILLYILGLSIIIYINNKNDIYDKISTDEC